MRRRPTVGLGTRAPSNSSSNQLRTSSSSPTPCMKLLRRALGGGLRRRGVAERGQALAGEEAQHQGESEVLLARVGAARAQDPVR